MYDRKMQQKRTQRELEALQRAKEEEERERLRLQKLERKGKAKAGKNSIRYMYRPNRDIVLTRLSITRDTCMLSHALAIYAHHIMGWLLNFVDTLHANFNIVHECAVPTFRMHISKSTLP